MAAHGGAALPATMRAAIAEAGKAVIAERPLPVPKPGEVLLKISWSALNRADTLQRKGRYPPPPGITDVLGLEAAGHVVAHGPAPPPDSLDAAALERFPMGTRGMALLAGGGNAEFVSLPAAQLLPIPTGMPTRTAAAIPETWLTAFQLLHLVGGLRPDDTVLVHAAGSGVGTAATQLATAAGAKVIACAGSADKLAVAASLGAVAGVNYKTEDVGARVRALTGGKGVSLILDPVAASMWKANADAAAYDARWVLYGSMGGVTPEGALFAALLGKRISLLSTTLRSRDPQYKAHLVARFREEALPFFSSEAAEAVVAADGAAAAAPGSAAAGGRPSFRPVVDSEFPLEELQAAHERMEANANTGKILLKVADE